MSSGKPFSKQLATSLIVPGTIVIVLWLVKIIEVYFHLDFSSYGNWPRELRGIKGIFLMPFIHGSWKHLISNSVPLLVLGSLLFLSYKEVALKVIFWVYLIGGVWLWIGGRTGAPHIGASGVVYGLASFLFFSGLIRRNFQLMAVSMLVVFLYGGIIWYVFPVDLQISWEGHLFGAIAGGICAWYYRKIGTQRKVYDWELEEDDEDEKDFDSPDESTGENPNQVKVNYIYKQKESDGEA